MTQPTQREKIFRFINSRKQTTAQEIANWFKIPVASARFHIRVLLGEGRIIASRTKRVRQLGKARTVYQIVENDDEDIYRMLLDELLTSQMFENENKDAVIATFAEKIIGSTDRRAGSLTLRLIDLIDRLKGRGYDARWEVHRNAPNVILQACPYKNSICRSSTFCEMDRRIIAQWTDRSVKVVKTLSSSEQNGNCVFEIE